VTAIKTDVEERQHRKAYEVLTVKDFLNIFVDEQINPNATLSFQCRYYEDSVKLPIHALTITTINDNKVQIIFSDE
jgi:hypothetical protein